MQRRIIQADGHSQTWQHEDTHCPHCGGTRVWVRVDDRDYTSPGDCAACVDCGAQWGLPNVAMFAVNTALR